MYTFCTFLISLNTFLIIYKCLGSVSSHFLYLWWCGVLVGFVTDVLTPLTGCCLELWHLLSLFFLARCSQLSRRLKREFWHYGRLEFCFRFDQYCSAFHYDSSVRLCVWEAEVSKLQYYGILKFEIRTSRKPKSLILATDFLMQRTSPKRIQKKRQKVLKLCSNFMKFGREVGKMIRSKSKYILLKFYLKLSKNLGKRCKFWCFKKFCSKLLKVYWKKF